MGGPDVTDTSAIPPELRGVTYDLARGEWHLFSHFQGDISCDTPRIDDFKILGMSFPIPLWGDIHFNKAYGLAKFFIQDNQVAALNRGPRPEPLTLAELHGVYVDGPLNFNGSDPSLVMFPGWASPFDYQNGTPPLGGIATLLFTLGSAPSDRYPPPNRSRVLNEFFPTTWKHPAIDNGLLPSGFPVAPLAAFFAIPFAASGLGGHCKTTIPECHLAGSRQLFDYSRDLFRDMAITFNIDALTNLSVPGLIRLGEVGGQPSQARLRMTVENDVRYPNYHLDNLQLHFLPPTGVPQTPVMISGGTLTSGISGLPDSPTYLGELAFEPGIHLSLPRDQSFRLNANFQIDWELQWASGARGHLQAQVLLDGNWLQLNPLKFDIKPKLGDASQFTINSGVITATGLKIEPLGNGRYHLTGEAQVDLDTHLPTNGSVRLVSHLEWDVILKRGAVQPLELAGPSVIFFRDLNIYHTDSWIVNAAVATLTNDPKYLPIGQTPYEFQRAGYHLFLRGNRSQAQDASFTLQALLGSHEASDGIPIELQLQLEQFTAGSEIILNDLVLRLSALAHPKASSIQMEIDELSLTANQPRPATLGDVTGPIELSLANPPYDPLTLEWWPEAGRVEFAKLNGLLKVHEIKPIYLPMALEVGLSGFGKVEFENSRFDGNLLVGGNPGDALYLLGEKQQYRSPPLVSQLAWRVRHVDRLVQGKYELQEADLCDLEPKPSCYDRNDPRVSCQIVPAGGNEKCYVVRDTYLPGLFEFSGTVDFASLPKTEKKLLALRRFAKIRALVGRHKFSYHFHPVSRAGIEELSDKLIGDPWQNFNPIQAFLELLQPGTEQE